MGILSLSSKLQERESSADSSVSKVKTMLLLLLRVKSLKSPLTRPSFTLTTLTTTTTTSATPTVSRSRRRSSSSSPTRTRTSGQDSYEFSRRSALSSLSPSSSPSKDIPCIETMYPSCPPLSSDSITSSTHLTQLTAKLPPGTFLKSPPLGGESLYTIRGRVMGKRLAGKGMLFLDVLPPFSKETAPSSSSGSSLKSLGSETVKDSPENTPCQVILKSTEYSGSGPAPDVLIHHLGLGDLVHVRGSLGKTHKGQPSLLVRSLTLLAPCLTLLPDKHKGLLDKELRYKNRAMDMIVNPQTLKTLSTRSKLIKTLRDQLHSKGFMELETPILSPSAGGALAKPFTTQGSASFLNKNTSSPLYLRIAPELYLKQLVIGGLPRVFEIGKQFRNEGIDGTHYPEFTTCEAYEAYTDVETVMSKLEDLLRGLVKECTPHAADRDSLTVQYTPPNSSTPLELDFKSPFQRIHIVDFLNTSLQIHLLALLEEPRAKEKLIELCQSHQVPIHKPYTLPRLLDQLISHFIEPHCVQPTFLYGHPSIMSPLARDSSTKGISDRFELFVAKKELINGYAELNDPAEQAHKFHQQAQDRDDGDQETPPFDSEYVQVLKLGLPPTVGWGLGIDRLVMFLTDSPSIREVIPFTPMK